MTAPGVEVQRDDFSIVITKAIDLVEGETDLMAGVDDETMPST
jgi:hypothetical protein